MYEYIFFTKYEEKNFINPFFGNLSSFCHSTIKLFDKENSILHCLAPIAKLVDQLKKILKRMGCLQNSHQSFLKLLQVIFLKL